MDGTEIPHLVPASMETSLCDLVRMHVEEVDRGDHVDCHSWLVTVEQIVVRSHSMLALVAAVVPTESAPSMASYLAKAPAGEVQVLADPAERGEAQEKVYHAPGISLQTTA